MVYKHAMQVRDRCAEHRSEAFRASPVLVLVEVAMKVRHGEWTVAQLHVLRNAVPVI